MIRKAVVAGAFYPAQPLVLAENVEACFKSKLGPGEVRLKPEKMIGAVVPHAGYVYSGPCAAHVYARALKADTVVILGPNHTGLGSAISASNADAWQTPLGNVNIDAELRKKIMQGAEIIDCEDAAHFREHCIEVQLPFLQTVMKNFEIVPITMALGDARSCKEVGTAIASAVLDSKKKVLVLASSDFSHYEPAAIAERKDKSAIEKILALQPEELLQTVERNNISMCGYAPVASMLFAAKELGAKDAKLLKYYTSGDVTGDKSAVVGYGAIQIW